MDSGCTTGGILRLLELIQTYPIEFAYDFRSRFNLSFQDIGHKLTYLEAIYLTAGLMKEPTSTLQAAHNKWKHPASLEWIVSTQIYDLLAAVNSKNKPKPYPMPWPDRNKNTLGSTKDQNRSDVLDRLNLMNPKDNNG